MTTTNQAGPVLGEVVARPRGIFWARTGRTLGQRFCEDATHAVYAVNHRREKPGCPGETVTVRAWACAVCWPKEEDV